MRKRIGKKRGLRKESGEVKATRKAVREFGLQGRRGGRLGVLSLPFR